MGHLLFLIHLLFGLTFGQQQYYDHTLCTSDINCPGTRYTCSRPADAGLLSCRTFFVYRASNRFATLTDIARLFNLDPDLVISINNTTLLRETVEPGHEVLVPITCSCTGNGFFQANFTYTVPESAPLTLVSCGVFEGLVKSVTLAEDNHLLGHEVVSAGTVLQVSLKCACPNNESISFEAKYLITYPIISGDDTTMVSEKFNVSVGEVCRANSMDPMTTLYPNTTILVPLKDKPSIDFKIPNADPLIPQLLVTTPTGTPKLTQLKKAYIAGSVITFTLIIALLVSCCLYLKALKKFKEENICALTRRIGSLNSCSTPFSEPPTRSSTNSCLSPDLLVGIKYSLRTYTIEDLTHATKNFNVDSVIGSDLYKGIMMDHGEVMIKRTTIEGTRQAIDVHSKINHVNIVKLHGVCYGGAVEDNLKASYLIFEHPCNGSLRDHLASSSSALHWLRRMQIAFDIAMGLHYLHYSIISGDTSLNLNSKNIFLTSTWRAKITVFGTTKESKSLTSWTIPRKASEKMDVFGFGVVLLELISGKEVGDGELSRESITFLRGGSTEGGCFDHLRSYVDPRLKDDYPLAEALCLSVLAGSCVEDDSMNRPSMEDVLKILARMV